MAVFSFFVNIAKTLVSRFVLFPLFNSCGWILFDFGASVLFVTSSKTVPHV